MPDHAYNVATQEGWQRPTVTGHHCMEATEQPLPNSLAGSEDPSDPEQTTRVMTVMLASEY